MSWKTALKYWRPYWWMMLLCNCRSSYTGLWHWQLASCKAPWRCADISWLCSCLLPDERREWCKILTMTGITVMNHDLLRLTEVCRQLQLWVCWSRGWSDWLHGPECPIRIMTGAVSELAFMETVSDGSPSLSDINDLESDRRQVAECS